MSKYLLFFTAIVIVIFAIFMQWSYNKIIFDPSNNIGIIDEKHEDLFLGIKTGKVSEKKNPKEENINIWLFEDHPGKRIMLFFHGNSGNISHRSYAIDICKQFELNLMLVDYRGYGKSDGYPSKKNIIIDGEKAYQFLLSKYKPDEIIVWGESLGGAPAVHISSKYNPRALCLLSTFSSITDVIEHGDVNIPAKKIVKSMIDFTGNDLKSRDWIKGIKCPVVIVHSKEDTFIPFKCAKILFDSIPNRCKKLVVIEGDHASPRISDKKISEIFNFIGNKRHKQDGIYELTEKLENVAQDTIWK